MSNIKNLTLGSDFSCNRAMLSKAGGLYGIEIKSAARVQVSDFNGLKRLSEITGKRFKRGVVLYTGEHYLGRLLTHWMYLW